VKRHGLTLALAALVGILIMGAAQAQGIGRLEGRGAAARITMERLVREMIDMERLAETVPQGVECDQQSSYDRASTSPDKPDTWFANGDAGQFIRQEKNGDRTEFVMSEMEGPGTIVRIWSANPDGGGNIRIYIDGKPEPAIEQDFLALTTEQVPEFPAPFSGRRSLGANLYFPIPYATSCKVTVDKPSLYYHVGYRTYPKGTSIEPFTMDAARRVRPVADAVGAVLSAPDRVLDPDSKPVEDTVEIPGRHAAISKPLGVGGPSAITRLEVKVDVPAEQLIEALRGTTITIKFDGEKTPSVWAPLGDFFGSTPGVNPFATLGTGMRADGTMWCNWFMPFDTSAEITFTNDTTSPVTVHMTAYQRAATPPRGGYLRFHAKWRHEWLPADPPMLDWPFLECTGPGRFVGVMQGVMNTKAGWWGEGDEKVWVDNDTFPSYFGTGSEDYFGYAWCNPALFTHAYHAQSIVTGPGNFGYTAVVRLHIFDDIPFQEKYRMTIEKWDGADRDYCCTAYWYSVPNATDFFRPTRWPEREVKPLPETSKVKGAIEGETLSPTITGGTGGVQQGDWDGISNSAHYWWQDGKVGDTLTVDVNVEKAGTYDLQLSLGTAIDYGIVQLYWDGKKLGDPFDGYHDGVVFVKRDCGQVQLSAGKHTLKAEIVGSNPAAAPAHMFGLDYILLKPTG